MPEERGLYPDMRVRDQLVYLARLAGVPKGEAGVRTDALLERLGVADRAGEAVQQLSLGNQQRVQLAAALVHEPEVLVLDEPFSGLDPIAAASLSELVQDAARAGRTVLFSSHQLDLVEDLCESVVIIDHGRLVITGRVEELATSGPQRLIVRVDGDPDGAWAGRVPGVTGYEFADGAVRLVLDDTADSQSVLAAAMAAGPVIEFGRLRRRLSEVFREAMA